MSININENYQTKIKLITLNSTDYVLYWRPIPNVLPCAISVKLNRDNKKALLEKEVLYWFYVNAKYQWLVTNIVLICYSTRSNYSSDYRHFSQLSARPSHRFKVQCFHQVCQLIPLMCCLFSSSENRLKH